MKARVPRLTLAWISLISLGLILTGQSYAQTDPQTIAGMWLFDEGGGDIAKDSSGNGNDGQLVNGPQWGEGRFGSTALEFDGIDDYVDCGNDASLDFGKDDFTLMAWIKTSETQSHKRIMSKRTEGEIGFSFHIYTSSGQLTIGLHDPSGWKQDQSNTNVADGSWHHVAVVADRDVGATFYLDGSFDGGGEGITGTQDSINNTTELTIAYSIASAADRHFKGFMDEVAIFNVALTEDDIKSIATEGISTTIATVSPSGRLTTTWVRIKTH